MQVNRIIGVDPGTNATGYALLEWQHKTPKLLELDVLRMPRQWNHYQKLHRIFSHLNEVIQAFQPQMMAVEAPFFGKNVQAMLKLGRAQGVAIAAGMANGLEVTEYSPRKIKQSVTGNGNASKEQVAAMLKQMMKADFAEDWLDATDALGAAWCHYLQYNSPIKAKKGYRDWASFLKQNPERGA